MIRPENRPLRSFKTSQFAPRMRAISVAIFLAALSVSSSAQNESHDRGVGVRKSGASHGVEKPSTVARPVRDVEDVGTTRLPVDVEKVSEQKERSGQAVQESGLRTGAIPGDVIKTQSEGTKEVSSLGLTDTEPSKIVNVVEGKDPTGTALFPDDWRKFDPSVAARVGLDISDDPATPAPPVRMFNWGAAIRQMIVMQAIQHSTALLAQEKTRRGLKGPFFSDYWNSVKGLQGWDDGNQFFTNYVAHPMQGATSGFIFIQNHERAKRQKFGESKEYWIDRLKTLAWAAAWSTNWELGPVSQASIGNVGLNGGMGYVDLVVTPVVGTAWTITEEALDRYIIRHYEGKNVVATILLRSFLNPMRTVANALRLKIPWRRERDRRY